MAMCMVLFTRQGGRSLCPHYDCGSETGKVELANARADLHSMQSGGLASSKAAARSTELQFRLDAK